MTDLHNLQERLNKDASLRKEFLNDPVSVLAKEGLKIPPAQEQAVRDLAAKARSHFAPPGSSVAPSQNAIEIKISIPI